MGTKVAAQEPCNTINYKNVFSLGGAFIAALAGSGFSTGQEILQFFTAFGYKGLLGIFISFLFFAYSGIEFIIAGHSRQFARGNEVYYYWGGKIIGTFYDYFSTFLVYMCFIVMVAGGGATLGQQYGLPVAYGSTAIAFLTCATVISGLDKIVAIIGKTGPFIATVFIAMSGVALWKNPHGLVQANTLIMNMDLMKASINWFFSAFAYVGFATLWLAGFVTTLGKKASTLKEARLSVMVGAGGFCLTALLVCLAMMAYIQSVGRSMVPSLALARNIHPGLATFFFMVILIGIYGASVPLLWLASSRISPGQSPGSKLITLALTGIGLFVALNIPFNRLINIIYVMSGYVGFFLIVVMARKRMMGFSKT